MQMPRYNIHTCFSVPIVEFQHPDCEALNAELKALFLAREKEGGRYRNPVPTPTIQVEIFESEFDLFKWPEPCVQRLKQFCFNNLLMTVARLNGYSEEKLRDIVLYDDTWFHITRYGGYIAGHNHPNASWSGVYCVTPGESVPDRPDSGVLRFSDPRAGMVMYMDAGNANLQRPFGSGSMNFRLRPGQLILFPSWLMHEVGPFFGRDERITVAFNCWFRTRRGPAPGGAIV